MVAPQVVRSPAGVNAGQHTQPNPNQHGEAALSSSSPVSGLLAGARPPPRPCPFFPTLHICPPQHTASSQTHFAHSVPKNSCSQSCPLNLTASLSPPHDPPCACRNLSTPKKAPPSSLSSELLSLPLPLQNLVRPRFCPSLPSPPLVSMRYTYRTPSDPQRRTVRARAGDVRTSTATGCARCGARAGRRRSLTCARAGATLALSHLRSVALWDISSLSGRRERKEAHCIDRLERWRERAAGANRPARARASRWIREAQSRPRPSWRGP